MSAMMIGRAGRITAPTPGGVAGGQPASMLKASAILSFSVDSNSLLIDVVLVGGAGD